MINQRYKFEELWDKFEKFKDLFSGGKLRILTLLFCEGAKTLSQLKRVLNMRTNYVKQYCDELIDANIIKSIRIKNQKIYQFNEEGKISNFIISTFNLWIHLDKEIPYTSEQSANPSR